MFGSRNPRPTPSQAPMNPYSRPPPPYESGYSNRPDVSYRQQGNMRAGGSHSGQEGQIWQLQPVKNTFEALQFGNLAAVSPLDFPPNGSDLYIIMNDMFVLSAKPVDKMPRGHFGLIDRQRRWTGISLSDTVSVKTYDPFRKGGDDYIGEMDAEIGFATQTTSNSPLDQDELSDYFKKVLGDTLGDILADFPQTFGNQVLAPGQPILMDFKGFKLLVVISKIEPGNLLIEKSDSTKLAFDDPRRRGICTSVTQITFFKDTRSGINLRASSKRPAANAILRPNFKFEDMGIGGLDKEFSGIFRRAFASRIFPPGLAERAGIQHVRGMVLYGPPGTGKTLIARKIGQMLNAREPKVINGPEVLNKYVGQSEENIRKLFADAEREYKEKGDESELHIIIFDEIDAICKQRGSGAAGGTGVGDTVVNQLLSKIDGVDSLNNVLLIGMTNRMDMIDEALLRSGRLELHMEISLPDENGRVQILNIHTAKMRESAMLNRDVDLRELAHLTKNFSGAEIAGLIRSAASFALMRHIKIGTEAGISDDVDQLTITRNDFEHALDEVKPAFGVSEVDMRRCLRGGIIHFSPFIEDILREGQLIVKQVQKQDSTPVLSAILHGPSGSGKTALAAKIALDSEFPLIKICSPDDMVGFNESMKIEHMRRIFDHAYKSPLGVVLLDNIERIVEWVPIGPRFSNTVLQALMVLLTKMPPEGRRLLILATTGQRSVIEQLDLFGVFGYNVAVPAVGSYAELLHIMNQSEAFHDPRKALDELRDITKRDSVNVGVKKILLGIETAKQDQDREGRFANVMARAMAQA
ncbi:MAG: hypothetical protein LQ351_001350 [Letrouitia transgressa]|nr:MAG: hypothetical protein LQ351_001350 [Letrouitia transgressa]